MVSNTGTSSSEDCPAIGCQGEEGTEDDLFGDEDDERTSPRRLRSKFYMDEYINPPEFLEARAKEMKEAKEMKALEERANMKKNND